MKTLKRYATVGIIALLLGIVFFQSLRSSSSTPAIGADYSLPVPPWNDRPPADLPTPELKPTQQTIQAPVSKKPGLGELTFLVQYAKYTKGGDKIMAKSQASIRNPIDGSWQEPEGTITAWIPAELWAPHQAQKLKMVGRTLKFKGVLGLCKKDGEDSSEINVQALEIVP